MGFDDLAKHMAARDGKKKVLSSGDGDQIIAEAAKADARMNRQRDLILGPILFVGGLASLALCVLLLIDDKGGIERHDVRLIAMLMGGAGAGIVVGGRKLIRGLRNKSRDDTAENQELVDALQRPPRAR